MASSPTLLTTTNKWVDTFFSNIPNTTAYLQHVSRIEDPAILDILERVDGENSDILRLFLNKSNVFEIVLKTDDTTLWSLCRANSECEAWKYFCYIQEKLLPLLSNNKNNEVFGEVNLEILQKLVTLLFTYSQWSSTHLAIAASFDAVLDTDIGQKQINSQECDQQMTPLHLAVKSRNLRLVQRLLENGAMPDICDEMGRTPLSLIINNVNEDDDSVEIYELLLRFHPNKDERRKSVRNPLLVACQEGSDAAAISIIKEGLFLKVSDDFGKSIHYALKFKRLLIVRALLLKDGTQGRERCTKYGATPLHWAKTAAFVKMILEHDYEMNLRSKTGDTALHVMVKRQRIDCVVALLAAGADPLTSDLDGDSPLHTACRLNNLDLVHALVSFGGDYNATNSKGETPRHLAAAFGAKAADVIRALHLVGTKRCRAKMSNCTDGCRHDGTYDGTPQEETFDTSVECDKVFDEFLDDTVSQLLAVSKERDPSAPKKEKVLCLDGGGVRGLILIQILHAIERASDKRILDSFDWIAGTSTGAVVGMLVAQGYCVDQIRKIFFDMKNRVFTGSRPYSSSLFEEIAKGLLGEDAKMKDIKKIKIMISGTLSNRSPPALHFFRNYKPPRTSSSGIATYSGDFDNPPRSFEDEERWRALRSTIAAPTYFPPFEGVMDGGLICNNPTTDALTEITEYYMEQRQKGLPPAEIGLVVSIGTGNAPVNKVSDISIVIPSGVSDIYKAYKSLGGAANVGSILLELVTDSRMRAVDRPRAWCQSIGAAYFRLSPTLSEETDLGEARDEKICRRCGRHKFIYIKTNTNYK